ncbi:putative bifunctional diguanylate cyclase/phosphodiesterase [Microvirga arabica]|uniref:putative bifunctional diguanylate cyclase/phosphodiesterase n=1 Tax=Microvirga arabica TaxID=1128671 RepID=UPI0019397C67|nr:bifunctional diguanylate cyclase/phosphodiesterase [Microvirga arabica]MBM1173748.1 GGDEF domain-containing protein [Microvirga arabica]
MNLDARTLAFDFILTLVILGGLLFFFWNHNRKISALAWWSATFVLNAIGIGLVNLAPGLPVHPKLMLANGLVALGYGALYTGARIFNERPISRLALVVGPALWMLSYPLFHDNIGARVTVISLITGGYAALSAWELWKHNPHRLTSQSAAVALLLVLTAFSLFRAVAGLPMGSMFRVDALVRSWSSEMALFLIVYVPALAFVFLGMAKERIEAGYRDVEEALRESEEHYRYSVELSPQIPWTSDPDGNLLQVSPRWHSLTGLPIEQTRGWKWMAAIHPDDVPLVQEKASRSLKTGKPYVSEFRVRLVDGTYRWFRGHASARLGRDGAVLRWYGMIEDIHERKLARDRLHWAAYHDDLTGLPNRRFFYEQVQRALDQATKAQTKVGLLLMDLDHLKLVNDRLGHDAGDALLREFARRLQSLAGDRYAVARLGGDEFGLLLPEVEHEDEVVAIARLILNRMQNPHPEDDPAHDCRTSIGLVVSLGFAMRVEDLQKQADLALYQSKAAGRGMHMMYNPTMSEVAQKVASALETAGRLLSSDWVRPFYQPKISLDSEEPVGFEALLRWEHPRLGIQYPGPISPAFDDTELGSALGARMRSLIFKDMRQWLDAGLTFGRVAVNVSAAEFRHGDYAECVLAELKGFGIPTSCLEVEVTESVFLDRNAGNVEQALQVLSAAGVTIALDDFGTGYASLTHLKRFPVHVIKIDRSFIRDIEWDAGDAAIVKALLGLGKSLHIEVVAEGVETAAQLEFLKRNGCRLVQGHYFAQALPASEVPQLMGT